MERCGVPGSFAFRLLVDRYLAYNYYIPFLLNQFIMGEV